MINNLFVKAYATDNRIVAPRFCIVSGGKQTIERIQVLAQMANEFNMESVSDHFPVVWESKHYASKIDLLAPALYVTPTQCWWSVHYCTPTGTEGFFTERFNSLRLLRVLELGTGDMTWSEDEVIGTALLQAIQCH